MSAQVSLQTFHTHPDNQTERQLMVTLAEKMEQVQTSDTFLLVDMSVALRHSHYIFPRVNDFRSYLKGYYLTLST